MNHLQAESHIYQDIFLHVILIHFIVPRASVMKGDRKVLKQSSFIYIIKTFKWKFKEIQTKDLDVFQMPHRHLYFWNGAYRCGENQA